MSSPAIQDYLKAIYQLGHAEQPASTSAVAARLGVAAASVSGMLRRLSEQGLVKHVPYYGARLTENGEWEAVRMIRRHRVLESFLVEVLGYSWDRVHDEAERLEHAASDELIDRMAQVLGEPAFDPHGAPIPGVGQAFTERHYPMLEDLAVGYPAVLREVSDEDPAALRYLAELELLPGTILEVLEQTPFNGPLRVKVRETERYVGRELARSIKVEPLTKAAATGGRDV